jgi:hypothetical protein
MHNFLTMFQDEGDDDDDFDEEDESKIDEKDSSGV